MDRVVQAIVEEIRGAQLGAGLQSDDADRDSTEADVRTTARLCAELDREVAHRGALKEQIPLRGWRQDNIDEFTALLKQTEAYQETLKKTSGTALFLLFSAEDDLGPDTIPSSAMQQQVESRLRGLTTLLKYIRARCHFLLTERPGEHGSAGYRQRRVATEAWRLLRRHGIEPAGGKMGSVYGHVTSLLWKAVTGEKELKDLERACTAVLQSADKGELNDDGIVIGRGKIRAP